MADAISEQAGVPGYLLYDALNELMNVGIFFESECERERIQTAIPFRNVWFGDGVPCDNNAPGAPVFHPPHHEDSVQ